ncbi:uncharacterized protein HD556DRAFT_9673 [Suillus plorans]|uniref:DUF6699 domain-containing protein n=1 Tax=Suillus plorans TaxID=116603 RepID=A0A9P7J954_9AGAM|nr:uncharacterized protein HD556DRAFT_9673 [Suillus plorans]KAG1809851.1 hypothetical protein HD556DRAFT_9673 [Suillus plorans]
MGLTPVPALKVLNSTKASPVDISLFNNFNSSIMHCDDCSSRSGGLCGWLRNSSFCRTKQRSRSVSHDIRTTPGSVPPWRNGFLPRYPYRVPAWADASRVIMPALPARQPDHNVWSYPAGNLTWSPHMNGLSYLPGTVPWTPATLFAVSWPQIVDERPKIVPCLATNPFQPDMPLLQWDIRQNPITARLTTGAHISMDLAQALSSEVTDIPVGIIEIAIPACPTAYMWDAIRVQRTSAIKVQDVLDAIYNWLQTPLTLAEMEHIGCVYPDGGDAIVRALQERASASPTLHGWEQRQGPRRIDCLGEVRRWMGLSYAPTGQGMQLFLNLQTVYRC